MSRARDTRLGRDVAIKILSPGVSLEPERLAAGVSRHRLITARLSQAGGTLPKWSADGSRLYFFSPDAWIMEALRLASARPDHRGRAGKSRAW